MTVTQSTDVVSVLLEQFEPGSLLRRTRWNLLSVSWVGSQVRPHVSPEPPNDTTPMLVGRVAFLKLVGLDPALPDRAADRRHEAPVDMASARTVMPSTIEPAGTEKPNEAKPCSALLLGAVATVPPSASAPSGSAHAPFGATDAPGARAPVSAAEATAAPVESITDARMRKAPATAPSLPAIRCRQIPRRIRRHLHWCERPPWAPRWIPDGPPDASPMTCLGKHEG